MQTHSRQSQRRVTGFIVSWLVALPLHAASDLAVSLDYYALGPAPVPAGSGVICSAAASNAGPDAVSASIAVTCPGVSNWSCSASGGATCQSMPPTGSGGFTHHVAMPAGSSLSWQASGINTLSFSGVVTAGIDALPVTGDPNPGNNEASTSIEFAAAPRTDFGVNIVGAPSFIGSGKTVSYVVEVGNYGSNAARETVDFSFNPSGPMTNTNVQCDPASAGACTAYPWRSVDVDLTPGATVRVHVSALFEWPLPPALGERMTFIAYIPSGTIHTNQANDRAEISTSLGVFASGFEME